MLTYHMTSPLARAVIALRRARRRGCRGATARRDGAATPIRSSSRPRAERSRRARAGGDDRDPEAGDRASPGRRLRRPAAQRPGLERDADERARHQHDRPRLDLDARDHAARAARRPLGLSRLLRLRDVGPLADPGRRDQADRGRARPGQRRVGRQRHGRRRQPHQPPAEGHGRAPRCSSARRTRASCTRPRATASATRCRRATSSRTPTTGRRARSPARTLRRRTRRIETTAPSSRASTSSSSWDTGRRRLRLARGRLRGDRRHPAQRHRPVRHRRAAPTSRTCKATGTAAALHVGASATLLDGDAVNLLTRGGDGAPLPLSFVSDTYTLDVSNTSRGRRAHTCSPTAGTTARRRSISRSRRGRRPRRVGAFLAGRDPARRARALGARRALRRHRPARGRRRHAAHEPDLLAVAAPLVPRVVQRGVPHAVGDQQLPRRDDPAAARAVLRSRPTPTATRSRRGAHDGLRDRLRRHVRQRAASSARRSTATRSRTRSTSTCATSTAPATCRRRAPRCRRP